MNAIKSGAMGNPKRPQGITEDAAAEHCEHIEQVVADRTTPGNADCLDDRFEFNASPSSALASAAELQPLNHKTYVLRAGTPSILGDPVARGFAIAQLFIEPPCTRIMLKD